VYVLVRSDLTVPQQAVQSAHAVLEASRQGLIPAGIDHPNLVLCHVSGFTQLLDEAENLRALGVQLAVFNDSDHKFPSTALATEPIRGDRRRLFKRFRLLKEAIHA